LARAIGYTAIEVTPAEWPDLLREFPAHSVFHTPGWFQAIESEHEAQLQLIKAADERGRAAAIWPVFATRKGPLRIHGSPVPGWNTAYLGPVFRADCDIELALQAFFRHEAFRRCAYFSCKVLNDIDGGFEPDLSPFGFVEVEKLDTYCVDVSRPLEELWNDLKSECRSRVRKARKLGLQVRHEHDASFIDEFWLMAQETFSICSIKPPFSREFVEGMWRALGPGAPGRDGTSESSPAEHARGACGSGLCALSAFLDGQRIATLVLPFDHHTMYYWSGASYLQFRQMPAHNLLHWEAIEHAHRLGLQRYDFISTAGGAGRFKKTFGPQRVHIATQWERTSSWVTRALKNGYRLYRQHAQRLAAG